MRHDCRPKIPEPERSTIANFGRNKANWAGIIMTEVLTKALGTLNPPTKWNLIFVYSYLRPLARPLSPPPPCLFHLHFSHFSTCSLRASKGLSHICMHELFYRRWEQQTKGKQSSERKANICYFSTGEWPAAQGPLLINKQSVCKWRHSQ